MPRSTLATLNAQIAALQKKADALREKERAGVIARILEAVEAYDIKTHELFGGGAKKKQAPAKSTRPKYRDPATGKEWSGFGPTPKWLKALTETRPMEDFLA